MREIKFRAWDGKKMYLPEYTDDEDFVIWPDGSVKVYYEIGVERHLMSVKREGWTIMQYTGLKDRYGKEIYEGDILRCTTAEGRECVGYIKYRDGSFRLSKTINPASPWDGEIRQGDGINEWFSIENMETFLAEIIGNIYETPELLKSL